MFVDDILVTLSKSKRGCHIRSLCVNSLMYADDLILLSVSVYDIQELVNLCVKEFRNIGMEINIKKSACIRIGKRHNIIPSAIIIDNIDLA